MSDTQNSRRQKAINALATGEEPKTKKPVLKLKTATKQKADPKPEESEDDEVVDMGVRVAQRKDNLQYQKMDQREHVLKRPDTYIGGIKRTMTTDPIWYLKDVTNDLKDIHFAKGQMSISEGLLRIFVEVLSNAIDNAIRSVEFGITPKFIKVWLTPTEIKVWNDGRNIPTNLHEKEKIPIPEMIFGHLLTSSNYDDTEDRTTSGKNGYGVKLANIFSTKFDIEIYNKDDGVIYNQTWENNMGTCNKPKISKKGFPKSVEEGKNGYTIVTLNPDFARFEMTELDPAHIALFKKYVYDTAMCASLYKVKVYLNDQLIPIDNIKDYIQLYFNNILPDQHLFFSTENSKVFVAQMDEFTQVSFANGVFTRSGGVHIDAWVNSLFKPVAEKINGTKKEKQIDVREIKKYMFMFVYITIPKPEFDTQAKHKLVGPKISVEAAKSTYISKLCKWDFVQKIKNSLDSKDLAQLKDTERKRKFTAIPDLDDANLAGSRHALECILCITEGKSAKSYVIEGMNVGLFGKKGSDYIGAMPIRGKFLNVKNAAIKTLIGNSEVKSIIQALGLQHGLDYTKPENRKKLRYGKFVAVSDADVDGYHITGLLFNFFHTLFPSLLANNDFFYFMRVPLIKITKKGQVLNFFYEQQARDYIEQFKPTKDQIKYFKGLGTATDQQVREDFGKRMVALVKDDECDKMMENIFAKETTDYRKDWIALYEPPKEYPQLKEYEVENLNLTNFLNKELINFSIDDCHRSIPCILDGLKESYRKILYAAFKRRLNHDGTEIKVAQFGGYVSEHTAYHHGEQNLYDTIINMAQRFVGTNNIPYFMNIGNFGSRRQGGEDAASARYIFTKLEKLTRLIFRKEDDPYLKDRVEDGHEIEKEHYLPIIPMILVNGCQGIGSGWSTNIPNHNPLKLSEWIRCWLNKNQNKPELLPWYNGFKGVIIEEDKKITSYGVMDEIDDSHYEILEIPVGKKQFSIDKYKKKLLEMMEEGILKNVEEQVTSANITKFIVTSNKKMTMDSLNLIDTIHTSNMVLYDSNGKLKRYNSVEEIMEEYSVARLRLYGVRKEGQLMVMRHDLEVLRNKIRFIQEVLNDKIVLKGKDEEQLSEELKAKKFMLVEACYDYLLTIQIRQMTSKRVDALIKESKELDEQIKKLEITTPQQIWIQELDEFEKEYGKWLEEHKKQMETQKVEKPKERKTTIDKKPTLKLKK